MTNGVAIIDHGAERKSIGHALRNLRHGFRLIADSGVVISPSGRAMSYFAKRSSAMREMRRTIRG